MFAGPIIAREVLTAPRPSRYYLVRAAYAGLFFILMWTLWQSLIGWKEVGDVGVLARFGAILFGLLSLVQMALLLFFAPLAAATAVAHEKDRRTFVLLLMTDLSDVEIVLGKLAASLLQVATLLAAGAPVLFGCLLLGGVAPGQVAGVLAVTAAAGLAGGSLGLVVALWRDRTFQSLAMTVLVVALVVGGFEAASLAFPGLTLLGVPLAAAVDPFRALIVVLHPESAPAGLLGVHGLAFVVSATVVAVALNAFAVAKLRVWNPGRNEPREQRDAEDAEVVESLIEVPEEAAVAVGAGADGGGHSYGGGYLPDGEAGAAKAPTGPEPGATTGLHVPRRTHRRAATLARPYRRPWANPIVWRELMTRAYGTKPLIIKGAYLLAFALGVGYFYANPDVEVDPWRPGRVLIALAALSLILVNAQGVTALTSERDTGALDLLLVTELTPREFIYGKLHGILYNTKEMLALPVALAVWFAAIGAISAEVSVYIIIDFLLLAHFAAMLGLHAAITYTNSRTAVANSLGTIFFLLVGIMVCSWLIILSDREFGRQLLSFLIFIGAGSVALYSSLGSKNPSHAIALVALLTPFWTFYCIISMFNGDVMAAFLFSVGIYGFALLAMLVPAVSDFDIALGRTNAIQG